MSELRRETSEPVGDPTSPRKAEIDADPTEACRRGDRAAREAKADVAEKDSDWRGGTSGPRGRSLVRDPLVQLTLNTVSTDDAYVNGHVTFVAARVKGQVSRVLVDDNYRVRKGDLLVQLDKEPFQIAVAIKKAAVDTATADLQVAKSDVRGIEAEAMSRRRALEHAMEGVDDQVAVLRARVADVDKNKAQLTLAQLDFDRAAKLVVTNDIPRSEYDRRQAELLSARANVVAALADVRQIRASLGLPPELDEADLGKVPPNLDQTFSSVLQAQAAMIQSAAQLGVVHSFDEGPRQMVEAFEKEGDVNTTFARLAADAPDVKQAEAKLEVAERDLAQAELDLRYCDVVAEIDGVITRRNVNPGDNIQVGQSLDGNSLAQRNLGRRQFQGDAARRLAHRPAGRSLCRHVWRAPCIQGSHFRLHRGDRINPGAAAARKRHGQLRQSRAAAAGSDRPRELRSGQEPAVHWHVGRSLRLL